jgi:hypothetical protein
VHSDDPLHDVFDRFAGSGLPTVSPPGPLAVRTTARRRRRIRTTALVAVVGSIVVAPALAYAALNGALPAPPAVSPSATATPSPSQTPTPTVTSNQVITAAELVAANPMLPPWGYAWAAKSTDCPTTGLVASTPDMFVPFLAAVAYANLDGDPDLEVAALLECTIGTVATAQVAVYDRDESGAIVLRGQLVKSTQQVQGVLGVITAAEGGVIVEVSNVVDCCGVADGERHSYRLYRFTGSGYGYTAAPADAPLRWIPDSLFMATAPDSTEAILPSFCGATYASDTAIRVRRSMRFDKLAIPDGVIQNTITTYRDGGAARFLDELAAAVRACPSESGHGNRIVAATIYGDESLRIEVSGGATSAYEVCVFRVGDAVEIIYELPGADWSEQQVIDFVTANQANRLKARMS